MSITIWLGFLLASAICIFSPGPTIMYIISQSLEYGKKSVFPAILGVVLGDFFAMVLSLAGLGILMKTSPKLFVIFKLFCACYLVYMGLKSWTRLNKKSKKEKHHHSHIEKHRKDFFLGPFLVTAFNPKDIMFFVAFFPQFITEEYSILSQSLILMVTFLILVAINISLYGYFSATLGKFVSSTKSKVILSRISGIVLITAGLITFSLNSSTIS